MSLPRSHYKTHCGLSLKCDHVTKTITHSWCPPPPSLIKEEKIDEWFYVEKGWRSQWNMNTAASDRRRSRQQLSLLWISNTQLQLVRVLLEEQDCIFDVCCHLTCWKYLKLRVSVSILNRLKGQCLFGSLVKLLQGQTAAWLNQSFLSGAPRWCDARIKALIFPRSSTAAVLPKEGGHVSAVILEVATAAVEAPAAWSLNFSGKVGGLKIDAARE